MARRIAAKIDSDPAREGLDHAREVCDGSGGGMSLRNEWMAILDRNWPEIRSVLLDDSEEGRRLRQSTRSAES
jgi:hypothetical protein